MDIFRRSIAVGIFILWTHFSWAEEPVHLHGKFVRADLVTDDLAVTGKFYGQLFGWTVRSFQDYATVESNGRELGRIIEKQRPENSDAKPRWIAFMSVADVAALQRKVVEAGGQVMLEPREREELGTLGVFSDPEGALFGAIHSRRGDPEDYIAEIGSWIWIELFSHDARRAGDFYARVGGYEVWDYEPQSEILRDRTNLLLTSDGYARAAVTEFAKERAHTKATWLPFIRVADTALVVRRAQELGGRVLVAPSPDIYHSRAAVLIDPRGAAIGIMEWSEESSGEDAGEQP